MVRVLLIRAQAFVTSGQSDCRQRAASYEVLNASAVHIHIATQEVGGLSYNIERCMMLIERYGMDHMGVLCLSDGCEGEALKLMEIEACIFEDSSVAGLQRAPGKALCRPNWQDLEARMFGNSS